MPGICALTSSASLYRPKTLSFLGT
jgi:hypothetical protein